MSQTQITYYMCESCREEEISGTKPCLLVIDRGDGEPGQCHYGLGFTSNWKEINIKKFQEILTKQRLRKEILE